MIAVICEEKQQNLFVCVLPSNTVQRKVVRKKQKLSRWIVQFFKLTHFHVVFLWFMFCPSQFRKVPVWKGRRYFWRSHCQRLRPTLLTECSEMMNTNHLEESSPFVEVHSTTPRSTENSSFAILEPEIRTLVLTLPQSSSSLRININIYSDTFPLAERLLYEFHAHLQSQSPGHERPESQTELYSIFLRFVLKWCKSCSDEHEKELGFALLRQLFTHFRSTQLHKNNLHAVLHGQSLRSKNFVTKIYTSVWSALRNRSKKHSEHENGFHPHKPAFLCQLETSHVQCAVIFGGQGINDKYFEELIQLWEVYRPILQEYIVTMSEHLKKVSAVASSDSLWQLEILKWLQTPSTRPDEKHFLQPHISLPVIGLIQLSQYLLLFELWGVPLSRSAELFTGFYSGFWIFFFHFWICNLVKVWYFDIFFWIVFFGLSGSTGHSQGIVSAVVVSASDSYNSFVNNSKKALALLYFIGLRSVQVFPPSFLLPRIRDDSIQHNEGRPTPMLSITNLYEEEVNSCIETVNKQLPTNKRICVALQNGPKAFVCSGPPESLYGLNVYLRSIKARPDEDQTRIPFHERKKNFNTRYLGMSVGFHCEYLKEALSILQQDIETFQLNWEVKHLKIPVFSTHDGSLSFSFFSF